MFWSSMVPLSLYWFLNSAGTQVRWAWTRLYILSLCHCSDWPHSLYDKYSQTPFPSWPLHHQCGLSFFSPEDAAACFSKKFLPIYNHTQCQNAADYNLSLLTVFNCRMFGRKLSNVWSHWNRYVQVPDGKIVIVAWHLYQVSWNSIYSIGHIHGHELKFIVVYAVSKGNFCKQLWSSDSVLHYFTV
jgi:hypothetical protein